MNGFPAKFAKGLLATADGRGGWEPVSALRLLTDAETAAAGTLYYGQGTKILATLAPATGLLMRNGAGAPTTTLAPSLDSVTATGTGGLLLKNSSGTTVATIGAGPGTGVTLAGALAITGALSGVTTITASSTTIIGTDPGGSELLRVGGDVHSNGKLRSSKASAASLITDANSSFKLYDSGLGAGLFGMQTSGSPYSFQLQVADATMAAYFPLQLQPRGGALILGTDPGGSELLRVGGAGRIGGSLFLSGILNMATYTPASASDTGTAGYICWDSSYLYVCTGTNTWKRAAIATW